MIAVKYLGTKEAKRDNIANSGVVWRGHGDVQEVTEEQAARLLAFPDVWADARNGKHKPITTVRVRPKNMDGDERIPPLINIAGLSREGMNEMATRYFGRSLDGDLDDDAARVTLRRMVEKEHRFGEE